MVFTVLLYNCSTWGLTKEDENMLDSFHRPQLQYFIGKKFPHIISNVSLYKRCKSYSISLFILKACWKLFSPVLRLDEKCPANAAMDYYFEEAGSKRYCGQQLSTTLKMTWSVHWRRCHHSGSKLWKALLICNVFKKFLKIQFCGEILLLTFTRFLKTRNHTCVPPNQNSHKEEEDTILNVTLFLLSTEDCKSLKLWVSR